MLLQRKDSVHVTLQHSGSSKWPYQDFSTDYLFGNEANSLTRTLVLEKNASFLYEQVIGTKVLEVIKKYDVEPYHDCHYFIVFQKKCLLLRREHDIKNNHSINIYTLGCIDQYENKHSISIYTLGCKKKSNRQKQKSVTTIICNHHPTKSILFD